MRYKGTFSALIDSLQCSLPKQIYLQTHEENLLLHNTPDADEFLFRRTNKPERDVHQ